MTLTPVGNAAGEAALDAGLPRQRAATTADDLLAAIRRGLVPGDPVARLLAGWTAPPVRAVAAPVRARRSQARDA